MEYDYHRDGPFNPKDREYEYFTAFDLTWNVQMAVEGADAIAQQKAKDDLREVYFRLKSAVSSNKLVYEDYDCIYHPDRGGWDDEFWQRFHDVFGPVLFEDA